MNTIFLCSTEHKWLNNHLIEIGCSFTLHNLSPTAYCQKKFCVLDFRNMLSPLFLFHISKDLTYWYRQCLGPSGSPSRIRARFRNLEWSRHSHLRGVLLGRLGLQHLIKIENTYKLIEITITLFRVALLYNVKYPAYQARNFLMLTITGIRFNPLIRHFNNCSGKKYKKKNIHQFV